MADGEGVGNKNAKSCILRLYLVELVKNQRYADYKAGNNYKRKLGNYLHARCVCFYRKNSFRIDEN